MNRRIRFFVGGTRSGKSAHAVRVGESLPGPRRFIATCPVLDEEMRDRIRRHRRERETGLWETVEEPLQLAAAVSEARDCGVVLIDCLALWVNNLMFEAPVTEEDVEARTRDVLAACAHGAGTVIFVSSEVGLGIIPADPLSRRYRDLLGRCNQEVAARADEVILFACGLPLPLKISTENTSGRSPS